MGDAMKSGSIAAFNAAAELPDRDDEDARCQCGGDHYGPQWAIVAIGLMGAAVVACSPALACDMREAGIDADDMWGFDESDKGTVLAWDGKIVVSAWDGPDGRDFDVDYEGTFRRLTEIEISSITSGRPNV